MPRSYSYFQANVLSPYKYKNNLKYVVNSQATAPYGDSTVAGIIFQPSYYIQKGSCGPITLFKIYSYAIERGFQVFQVQANINSIDSKLQINFVSVDVNDKLPIFQGDQIDMELRGITSLVYTEFDGQAYQQKVKDIYTLIQKIGWRSQLPVLKKEISTIGYSSGGMTYKILGGIAIIMAVTAFFVFKNNSKLAVNK